MNNLNFQKVRTPNARLLYSESYGLALDWNLHESKVSQYIKTNPKIRLANPITSLYFFSSPDDENFSNATCWVSKEIIGMTPVVEGIQSYDLDGGEAFRFQYSLNSPKDFLIGSIISFFDLCRSRLKQDGIQIALSWRIGITSSFVNEDAMLMVWLDFFKDSEVEEC